MWFLPHVLTDVIQTALNAQLFQSFFKWTGSHRPQISDKNVGLKFSFNFFNFSCLFLLFKEFTKNQEDTHLCFVTIVCEVITRTIRITAFWKENVEMLCWWPSIRKPEWKLLSQQSHLLPVFPFLREATARFLLLNTWYAYFCLWRSLTANAYELNINDWFQEKNMRNRYSDRKIKTKRAIETILGSRVYFHPFLIRISLQKSLTTQFM